MPAPGRRTALLAARADIDVTTRAAALAAVFGALDAHDGLVLALSGVFVGVDVVRDLVALSERATRARRPVAVVGAPRWLVDLVPRLDMPPLRFADTVEAAVSTLRAAATG